MAHYCSGSTLNCCGCCSLPSDPSHIQETLPRAERPGHGLSLYHWEMTVRGEGEFCIKLKLQTEVTKKKKRQPKLLPDWDENGAEQIPYPRMVHPSSSGRLYSCSVNAQHHIPIPQHQGAESTCNFTLSCKLLSQELSWVTFPLEIRGVRLHD